MSSLENFRLDEELRASFSASCSGLAGLWALPLSTGPVVFSYGEREL